VLRGTNGRTLVRRPGARVFEEIRSKTAVPLGSIVDVQQGAVIVSAAPGAGAKAESAKFYGGVFTVTQPAGVTELALSETLKCGKTRKLWGDGSGSFRIRGRFGSATGRGTKWLVQDSCHATLVRVERGVAAVRDNATRKTVLVRSGRRYTATAKKR
jgi:ferric-dicitrate binding protein FerR (iron transport regulator)